MFRMCRPTVQFFAVFTTVYFNDATEMNSYGMPRHDWRNQLRIRPLKFYEFIDRICNAE